MILKSDHMRSLISDLHLVGALLLKGRLQTSEKLPSHSDYQPNSSPVDEDDEQSSSSADAEINAPTDPDQYFTQRDSEANSEWLVT